MRGSYFIIGIFVIQAVCAVVFVSDILFSVLGINFSPIPWRWQEYIEIGAAFGLVLGLVLGAVALHNTQKGKAEAEQQLRLASGAFNELLQERFAKWGLTPAEADVALFVIKGLGTQEIAFMRRTSDGTVKAQTNAIYRKAGVSGRHQLLSLFIEEMMEGKPLERVELERAG